MRSVTTHIGLFVLGVVVAYGFAFTIIGLLGEAIAVLALLGLAIRCVQFFAGRIGVLIPRR